MSDPAQDARRAFALEMLGVLLAAATVWMFRDCVVDDAYISLTYAANALAGEGLVFNPGERVEGFSNLGFVVAVTGLGGLGLDLVTAARLLGSLGAALAIWLGPAAVLPGQARRMTRALARLWCLASFAFVYLAWTGLETGFFAGVMAALVFVVARAELRLTVGAGLLAGLLFATRPEGALVAMAIGGVVMWRRGTTTTLRMPGTWAFVAIAIAVEGFRLAYYGAWVPHPAVVKGMLAVDAPGRAPWYGTFGDDVVEFFAQTGGVVVLLLVGLSTRRGATSTPGGETAAAACAALVAFTIYSGGDWMLGYRYLCPMLPLYASLAAAGAVVAYQSALGDRAVRPPWRLGAAVVIAVGALYCFSFGLRFRQDIRQYPNFVMTSRDMTAAARWLADRYPAGTTITCWRIGALRYYSGLTVIDTNGLTDAEIPAHLADAAALDAHLATRQPTLALLRGRPGEPAPRTRALYGASYRFVREFAQGDAQTWQLYELAPPL